MGKLFNLREWLTLPETARHLSNICAEEVSETDVLRLVLDGHLKLSVNFVNHAMARRGRYIPFTTADLVRAIESGEYTEELKWHFGDGELLKKSNPHLSIEEAKKLDVQPLALRIDDERFLTLNDDVTTLKGIWDLPLIGNERLDVEHLYQSLTGGPDITLSGLDGAFVESFDGACLCQLQDDFDDNEYQPGSLAQLEVIKNKISNKKMSKEDANVLLEKHQEDRIKFLERRKMQKTIEKYYPAGGLPRDCVWVVRTEAIRAFEQSITDKQELVDKPLTTTERNGLLTVIAALCNYSDIKHDGRGAAPQIAKLTEEIGAAVGEDTIRSYLAKIPNALVARKK